MVEKFTKNNATSVGSKNKTKKRKRKTRAFYTDLNHSKFKLASDEEPRHKLIKSR